MTARRCTGAVIAGGRGTRMGGRAKGLERVGSARMVDRVASALRDAARASYPTNTPTPARSAASTPRSSTQSHMPNPTFSSSRGTRHSSREHS
jgi:molybdopterin-guanine dinucleotide biosynthesis protein A